MTFPGIPRYTVALVATLGLFMLATGTAQAGVASVAGPVISFKAGHGELNDVVADPRPDGVLFTDASAPLTAGDGCSAQIDGVLCPYPDASGGPIVELRLRDRDDSGFVDDPGGFVTEMRVLGGRGADSAFVSGSSLSLALADGGPGDDVLTSATNFVGSTTLRGGSGRDELVGAQSGVIRMEGGRGADRLDNGPVPFFREGTAFDGGRGDDTILFHDGGDFGGGLRFVSAGRGFDTINLEDVPRGVLADFQTCPAGCGVERVVGSPFDDILQGDASSMRFDGGAGNDTIDPGAGWDSVFAGAGNDQVNVGGDRQYDFANCGADDDTVLADHRDQIAKDCETVTRAEAVP